jgi:hypothetical protein
MFFFEKKNQKTLAIWWALPARPATAVPTFLRLFFTFPFLRAWGRSSPLPSRL